MPRISLLTSTRTSRARRPETMSVTASCSLATRYDAIVVGARCAGAATALALAKSGAKVLVVDRQAYGSDAMSTHALMRGAVVRLNRWRLLRSVTAAGTPEIRAVAFHYGGEPVRVDVKPDQGVDCLLAPRRTVLDPLLVDAAWEAGAEVRHGVAVSDLHFSGTEDRVTGASLRDAEGRCSTVRADIVVGADGRQSTVARLVNARIQAEGFNASGIVFGYFEGLKGQHLRWYFAKDVAAGVIPTNAGHCVFAAVPAARFLATFRGDMMQGFLRVLERNCPGLRAEIEQARLNGHLRSFGGVPSYLRQCQGPGWALVGDAGYFKDPLTAHGITDAFRDAQSLSEAIARGGTRALEAYQHERDEHSLPFLRVTDAIASFSWDIDGIKQLHADLSAAMKQADRLASSPQPLLEA